MDDSLVLVHQQTRDQVRKMRIDTGKSMGGVSGLRAAYLAGDGRITAADGADSGELFRRPGGTIYLGFEGEKTRHGWGIYGDGEKVGSRSKTARNRSPDRCGILAEVGFGGRRRSAHVSQYFLFLILFL